MNNENEVSNKKLSEVAGGTEAGNPEPKYRVGQHLWEYFNITMNYAEFEIVRILKYKEARGYEYDVRRLSDNTHSFRYLETLTNIYEYDPRG